jgi:FkbM family methyltransferase
MMHLSRILSAIPRRLRGMLPRNHPIPEPLRSWAARAGPFDLVDVGTNRGQFFSDFAGKYPIRRAWLIEPQEKLAKELTLRFPPPRCCVRRLALADRQGSVELEIDRSFDVTASLLRMKTELSALSHLSHGVKEVETCPMDTLDHFAESAGIDGIDLLKIDTQGTELLVLRGGDETLRRTRAVWVELSLTPLYEGACLVHEVVDHLHSRNLYLRDVSTEFRGPAGELLQVNGLFTRN